MKHYYVLLDGHVSAFWLSADTTAQQPRAPNDPARHFILFERRPGQHYWRECLPRAYWTIPAGQTVANAGPDPLVIDYGIAAGWIRDSSAQNMPTPSAPAREQRPIDAKIRVTADKGRSKPELR